MHNFGEAVHGKVPPIELRTLVGQGRKLVQRLSDPVNAGSNNPGGRPVCALLDFRTNSWRCGPGGVEEHKNTPSGSKYRVPPAPETGPLKSSARGG
jgi:hypothetical protein